MVLLPKADWSINLKNHTREEFGGAVWKENGISSPRLLGFERRLSNERFSSTLPTQSLPVSLS